MSVSIDKDPADQAKGFQAVLASWLDDYGAGRCDLRDMQESFRSVCRSNPEAPWDALALLDQYQRRGRIDAGLARTLKSEIAQLVFGIANHPDTEDESDERGGTGAGRAAHAPARPHAAPAGQVEQDLATAAPSPPAPPPESQSLSTVDIPETPMPSAGLQHPRAEGDHAPRQGGPGSSTWREAAARVQVHAQARAARPVSSRADRPAADAPARDRAQAHPREPRAPEPAPSRDVRQGTPAHDSPRPGARAPRIPELGDAEASWAEHPVRGHVHARPRASQRQEPVGGRHGQTGPVTRPVARPGARTAERRSTQRQNPRNVLRGRYELVSVLSRTSTGAVHKALDRHRTHLPASSRMVAVKVFDQVRSDAPEVLADLERRFHLAQSLAHPNMVGVFDLDRDGETYFLVMELLEGEPLSSLLTRLDGRRLPRDRALAIVAAIGAALNHAHRRGVAHGDLKPGNVMITANGEVKVLGFGFAGRASEPWIGDGEPHAGLATTAYASPGRVPGTAAEPADDVYALACIAYELLAGRHPYDGRSGALARANGRRPPRIRGLSKRQWQVLHRALGWTRSRVGVAELVGALGGEELPPRLLTPHELLRAAAEEGGRRASRWRWLAAAIVVGAAGAAALGGDRLRNTLVALPAMVEAQLAGSLPGRVPSSREVRLEPAGRAPDEDVSSPGAPGDSASDARPGSPAEPTPEAIAQPPIATVPPDATPAPAQDAVGEPRAGEARQDAAATSQQDSVAPPPAGPPSVQFQQDTYTVRESDGAVRLTIVRQGSVAREAVFGWRLRGASAEPGRDYADIGPGTERIPAGARSVVLALPLVSDALREGTELFTVELQAVEGGPALGARTRATVIVIDDD